MQIRNYSLGAFRQKRLEVAVKRHIHADEDEDTGR